jgi:hypothetical protein
MTPDATTADRNLEVREAARNWHRVGAVDESTRDAILALYPDDRARLGPAFRVLVFIFACFALQSGIGIPIAFMSMAGRRSEGGVGALLLVFGISLAGLTEWQLGVGRRSQGGTEAATGFVALGCLLGGVLMLMSQVNLSSRDFATVALAVAAALLAVAAVRWGVPLYAATSATCALGLAIDRPGSRVVLLFMSLVLGLLSASGARSWHLPPSHRASCRLVLVIALVVLYVVVHVGGWDIGLFEERSRELVTANASIRPLFVAATAFLPLLVLGLGLIGRWRLLFDLGALLTIASLVTLRYYVHLAPLWVVLTLGGTGAMGVALGLRRWLDGGAERERGGFTAEPLFEDEEKQRILEAAVAVTQVASGPHAKGREFQGGGGSFGGGGASGEF